MPELPEVEVTRRGVAPHVEGGTVTSVTLRRDGLRWPFPPGLAGLLAGRSVRGTGRRGKYLLLHFDHGTLIIHLGMSGHLCIVPPETPPQKHDHFDLALTGPGGGLGPGVGIGTRACPDPGAGADSAGAGINAGIGAGNDAATGFGAGGACVMRLTDPRRFGAVLWHAKEDGPPEGHPLLRGLGVEPLEDSFSGALLHRESRTRSAAIKQVLLAGDIVVGVGNIYASESLFRAGIHPATAARRVGLARCDRLAQEIRAVLEAAITKGGSTLRDFIGADGKSGYFQQSYFVYDRGGMPCRVCGGDIRQIKQGQRSTFFCPRCQK